MGILKLTRTLDAEHLLTDLNHDAPSRAQASYNLVRCAFAGMGTGVLQTMIDRVGVGCYFTILAGACATPLPFLVLQ
jgi:hypothetical protein